MATRTKIGILAETLSGLNPWWRSATWADTDRDLVRVRDSGLGYEADVLRDLQPGGLYVLRGPRRVGKTVASKQAIARLIDAGVPRLAIVRYAADGMSESDLRSLVQRVAIPAPPAGGNRWWFLDEITAATGDWAGTIKWLRDNNAAFADATVVLTGSNAEKLTEALGDWPGRRGEARNLDRAMLPVGFRTFVRLLVPDAPDASPRLPIADLHNSIGCLAYQDLLPWVAVLGRAWDLYLLYGGFPLAAAAAKRGEPIPDSFLDDMFAVIFRDVFRTSQASETTTTNMVSRLMEGMGSPANLSSIADDADVAPHTVSRHVDHLRNAYLVWTCPQRAKSRWLARTGSQAKVYAVDPLIARLAHLRNTARADIDPTILTEMMLGMAIRRAAVADGRAWEGDDYLFHWRTPARKEIDFVSELFGGAALEGKFVDDGGWNGEAPTVNASEWSGILATRSVLDTSADDAAWAVPAGILAYLIDT